MVVDGEIQSFVIGLRCCWRCDWSVQSPPCSSPCSSTPLLSSCRQLFAEQKSSSCEGLMAWSCLPFHRCTHGLEKWFRLTVIGGGSPPQRNHLSSAMTIQGCVCDLWEWYCNSDRSPTGLTSQPGQVDLALTPCLGCCLKPHRSLP